MVDSKGAVLLLTRKGSGLGTNLASCPRCHLEKVAFQGEWVLRILFIFEILVWAFDFRSKEQRQMHQVAYKSLEKNELRPMGWDDKEEIRSWQESLEWWVSKCRFCAGKGLSGALINHTLRDCSRGGMAKTNTELGECVYLEGIKAQGGCDVNDLFSLRVKAWQRSQPGLMYLILLSH
jgi:hypothetical protein